MTAQPPPAARLAGRLEARVARVAAWCAVVLLAQAWALAGTGSAEAHPFGPPQTAAVDLDPENPDTVRVRWRVGGEDDLALLGVDLGVLPPDRVLQDGATFYRPEDGHTLMADQRFASYLTDTVRVRATDGAACTGRLVPLASGDRLETQGVTLLFRCPGATGRPSVTLTTLTDLHPAYRTLASGPDGQRAVYTQAAPSHTWHFEDPAAGPREAVEASVGPDATSAPARSAVLQLGGLALGAVVVAGVALRVARSRRTHAD